MASIISVLLGWLPLVVILLVMFIIMRRNVARSNENAEIGRQNTEAIRANTDALKAVLAKLENLPK